MATAEQPVPFAITKRGTYMTRDGYRVHVKKIDLSGEFPIEGEYSPHGDTYHWMRDGRYMTGMKTGMDIIRMEEL